MTKKNSLTAQQISFIEENKKRLSSRQIAKALNLSRSDVEAYLSSAKPKSTPAVQEKRGTMVCIATLIMVTFLAFSSALQNGFVWDDRQMIENDKTLEQPAHFFKTLSKPLGYYGSENPKGTLWRPVETMTFFLDTFLWHKEPFGYHMTNLLLHLVSVVLFFFVVSRFIDVHWLSAFAAMLYAVHPVHVESVAYIPSRGEILCGIFVLASFLLYRRSTITSCLLYFAAMYSKETAIVFIGALVVYDAWVLKEKDFSVWALFRRYGFYALCAAVYLGTRFYLIGGLGSAASGDTSGGYYSWPNRFWIQPVYFAEYMKMIFMPINLHVWRQLYFPRQFSDPVYLTSFIVFLCLLISVYYSFRKSKVYLFGFVWFLLFLIPVLNFFVIVNSPALEHWLYIPLMGFVIFLFGWIRDYLPRQKSKILILQGALLSAVVLLTGFTFRQNKIWKDEVTLFEYTTRFVTRDPTLYSSLGVAYAERKRFDKAEQAFKRALALDPNYQDAVYNLRMLEYQKGRVQPWSKEG